MLIRAQDMVDVEDNLEELSKKIDCGNEEQVEDAQTPEGKVSKKICR